MRRVTVLQAKAMLKELSDLPAMPVVLYELKK